MKKAILYLFYATTLLLANACSKEQSVSIPFTGDYLPMQVGNLWDMENTEPIKITRTKVFDNKTFFEFIKGTSDTNYYRTENGKIYVRQSNIAESVKFDLNANVNDTWKYSSGWNVKLVSKTDTLLINHTKVPNCYQFFFDIPEANDEEHTIWLAPGIGFIRIDCGFCPYPFLNLEKAVINQATINFP